MGRNSINLFSCHFLYDATHTQPFAFADLKINNQNRNWIAVSQGVSFYEFQEIGNTNEFCFMNHMKKSNFFERKRKDLYLPTFSLPAVDKKYVGVPQQFQFSVPSLPSFNHKTFIKACSTYCPKFCPFSIFYVDHFIVSLSNFYSL